MTPEEFYDARVAPALAGLAQECQAHGLSFLAVCEWEPGSFGRTAALQPHAGFGILTANDAAQANGNIDALLLAISKRAGQLGHSSAFLRSLGIPASPPDFPAHPVA